MNIQEILELAIERKASDIILSPGNYPSFKLHGEIVKLEEYGIIDGKEFTKDLQEEIPEKYLKELSENMEMDFSINTPKAGRFRVNGFKNNDGFGLVFRVIPSEIPEFDSLGIPQIIKSFSDRKSGLLLVTGGVGSGKSTTLASLINEINRNYKKHIITIEDPIEYIHPSKNSLIEQREVGKSTQSFENGLKYALRQASDVIMIGEMRDLDTFRLALRAAETGNLVMATLHTSGAARTVARIIDMFPAGEKDQIRAQVAESLIGVVWQDLIPTVDGGRVPATEVMIKTKAIENMIRENHFHQINNAIETGKKDGMIAMRIFLKYLLEKNKIDEDTFHRHMSRYGLDDNTDN